MKWSDRWVAAACFLLLVSMGVPSGWGAEQENLNAREPATETEWRYWLENMIGYHRFTDEEVAQATGQPKEEIAEIRERLEIRPLTPPASEDGGGLFILPYPGGRHPRIGFHEGAIRPQRETKVSVFLPWEDARNDYVVVDVPEAIWSNLGLTYLAHTHVETLWTKGGIELPKLEWNRDTPGVLMLTRELPNQIRYSARVEAKKEHVEMILQLTNGTEQELTGLRVQNCIMLKGAPDFAGLTNENKVLEAPFAAVRSSEQPNRWIITAWEPCHRPWGNAKVPCLHSDPKFPDCDPGQTVSVKGWLSFYEGDDLAAEFKRIRAAFFP